MSKHYKKVVVALWNYLCDKYSLVPLRRVKYYIKTAVLGRQEEEIFSEKPKKG